MLRGAMKPALVLLDLKASAACANLSAIDTRDFMRARVFNTKGRRTPRFDCLISRLRAFRVFVVIHAAPNLAPFAFLAANSPIPNLSKQLERLSSLDELAK